VVRDANAYLDKRAPWKTIKTDAADAALAVYAVLKVIDNCKTLLAPFLPFTAQQVHEFLGYDGQLFGVQHLQTYQEAARAHQALTYDASAAIGRWAKSDLQPGQALREHAPEIVEVERARLGQKLEEKAIVVG
jgi:methionyl-tRNA synthetase